MHTRGRPEIHNLAFADAGGSAVTPREGVCCLAMHFRPRSLDADTDTIRIQSMLTNLNVDGVLSVAWGITSYPGFCGADFKQRVPLSVIEACRRDAKVVCLDYLWLQRHYYRSNYGGNWVSQKAIALLEGGVRCVILPYDLGNEEDTDDASCLACQLRDAGVRRSDQVVDMGEGSGLATSGGVVGSESLLPVFEVGAQNLSFFDLTWRQAEVLHPLVAATRHVNLVSTQTGRSVHTSSLNYLSKDRSFAVFFKSDGAEEAVRCLRRLCNSSSAPAPARGVVTSRVRQATAPAEVGPGSPVVGPASAPLQPRPGGVASWLDAHQTEPFPVSSAMLSLLRQSGPTPRPVPSRVRGDPPSPIATASPPDSGSLSRPACSDPRSRSRKRPASTPDWVLKQGNCNGCVFLSMVHLLYQHYPDRTHKGPLATRQCLPRDLFRDLHRQSPNPALGQNSFNDALEILAKYKSSVEFFNETHQAEVATESYAQAYRLLRGLLTHTKHAADGLCPDLSWMDKIRWKVLQGEAAKDMAHNLLSRGRPFAFGSGAPSNHAMCTLADAEPHETYVKVLDGGGGSGQNQSGVSTKRRKDVESMAENWEILYIEDEPPRSEMAVTYPRLHAVGQEEGAASGAARDSVLSATTLYDQEGHGSMNVDLARNRYFIKAIDEAWLQGASNFLEIGPGANAKLTMLILNVDTRLLDHPLGIERRAVEDEGAFVTRSRSHAGSTRPRVTAIEFNPRSAAKARQLVGNRCVVMEGDAATLLSNGSVSASDFDCILAEVIGLVASCEGQCRLLMAAGPQAEPLVHIPAQFGTYFCASSEEARLDEPYRRRRRGFGSSRVAGGARLTLEFWDAKEICKMANTLTEASERKFITTISVSDAKCLIGFVELRQEGSPHPVWCTSAPWAETTHAALNWDLLVLPLSRRVSGRIRMVSDVRPFGLHPSYQIQVFDEQNEALFSGIVTLDSILKMVRVDR